MTAAVRHDDALLARRLEIAEARIEELETALRNSGAERARLTLENEHLRRELAKAAPHVLEAKR